MIVIRVFHYFLPISSTRQLISMYMKNFFLMAVIFSLPLPLYADHSTECHLMARRISNSPSDKNICLEMYHLCSQNVRAGTQFQQEQNLCSSQLGECQMGGILSGEALETAKQNFNKLCKVNN